MIDLMVNFLIGLAIVGVPCYTFYRIGMDAGIQRGIRRQILRDLTVGGIIEKAEPQQNDLQAHS